MAILSKGTTYADGDQITSTNLNALVDSATFAAGAVESGGGLQLNGSGQLKVAGNVDIGTSNLTATGSISLGATTFNDNNITNVGSIAVDTIIADNTDVTIDAAGDIILDADGAQVRIKDGGTERFIFNTGAAAELDVIGTSVTIHSNTSDADIIFKGNDGGSSIDALTLDMSAAGAATFNDKVIATELDISGDVDVDGTLETDALSIASTAVTATAAELNYNDTGASVGTVVAGKTVTVDSNKDVSSFRNVTVAKLALSNQQIESTVEDSSISVQGGVTGGAFSFWYGGSHGSQPNFKENLAATTKWFSADGNTERMRLDSTGLGVGKTPSTTFDVNGSAAFSGNIDVDGTTNLDAVDIDGAVDMASTLTVAGEITANGTATINRLGLGVSAHASAALNITSTNQHIRFNNGSELGIIDLDSDGELNIWAHGDGEVINLRTGSGVGTDIVKVNSTGIDVTGTAKMDGLNAETSISSTVSAATGTVGRFINNASSSDAAIVDIVGGNTSVTSGEAISALYLSDANANGRGRVEYSHQNDSLALYSAAVPRLNIANNGDISFYEDTGSTAKLFWDASAESLGIGTTSPDTKLAVSGGYISQTDGTRTLYMGSDGTGGLFGTTTNHYLRFITNNTERLLIDSSGNVSIGGTLSCTLADGVTAATQNPSDNSTKVATTAYVDAATGGGGGSGGAFTTLTASDDVNFDSGTFFVDASANKVGIGTTSPTSPLHVQADGIGIKLDGSSNTTKSIFFRQTNSSNPAQVFSDGSLRLFTEDSGTDIRFHVNSDGSTNEKLRINATGVGIGTNAPSNTLHVKNTTSSGAYIQYDGQSNTEFGLRVESNVSGGNFEGDFANNGSMLDLFANSSSTSGGDILACRTQATNAVFLVRGNGHVFQNCTAAAIPGITNTTDHGFMIESDGSDGSSLHVARKDNVAGNFARQGTGDVVMFRNTNSSVTEAGSIEITGATSVAYRTSSDYRLKENVVDVSDGIDRVKQLNPVRFNFIGEDPVVDGFLAHEVQDIVPEAIGGEKDGMKDEEYEVSPAVYEDVVHPAVEATYDEDGNELTPAQEEYTEKVLVTEKVMGTRTVPKYQGIDQSKLVPLLTAALQEAVAKIEALEARVQTLEG